MTAVDTILRVGRAYLGAAETVQGSWAEDVDIACLDGRIVAMASAGALDHLVGPRTEKHDLGSRVAYPGFVDSHTHLKRASLIGTVYLDCAAPEVRSVDDVLAEISRRAAVLRPTEWIQGDNLNPLTLREQRFPTRQELDHASGGRPVILRGVGRHVVVANSAALAAASIDAATPDVPGGRIERDADGEPNGVLHERAKFGLDTTQADTVVPPPSEDVRLDGLRDALLRLHRRGITTIHEIPRARDEIGDYLALRQRGDLGMRVAFYIRGWESSTKLEHLVSLGLRSGFGDDWLSIAGVKFSVDGSAMFRNAAVHEPYPGEDGGRGLVRMDVEQLSGYIAECRQAGLRVAVHAIGDRALDIALDAYEQAPDRTAWDSSGDDRIEHGFVAPGPDRLERMARLGLTLSQQPGFIESSGSTFAHVFQDGQLNGFLPVAGARARGVRVILNSDYPNAPADPFVTLRCAVTRRSNEGQVVGEAEAVDLASAFHMMTEAPARTIGRQGRAGRLAEGMLADLFVTDEDFMAVPADELDQVPVAMTFVGASPVYAAG
jgi:predicted amidohydrolase YtcJ